MTTLAPGLNNLEFRYTALSLLAPTRTTFRYMLEGFDKDWIDAGTRREAFYTNLAPRTYRFRVMATLWDGNVAEAANAVSFRIQPHFYQRAIFVPLLVLLAASLLWLAYWRRVRIIRANARAVLAERSRIARELHDTLMQGFSGVTMEMQALAGRLPESDQRGTLEEIIRDAGHCLREARISVAGLRTGIGPASGLAQSIAQAARQIIEDKDIKLRLAVTSPAKALPPEVEYNLLNIVREAVTNAAKHSRCRFIDVAMSCNENLLTLTIKDDGVGITEHAGPGHYGLIGIKERAAQIGATFELETAPGKGTSICLELPLPGPTPDAAHVVPHLQPRYS